MHDYRLYIIWLCQHLMILPAQTVKWINGHGWIAYTDLGKELKLFLISMGMHAGDGIASGTSIDNSTEAVCFRQSVLIWTI